MLVQIRSVFLILSHTSPEKEFVSLAPAFVPEETAKLDKVREFRVDIEAFPTPKVTWLKDGVVLDDISAELATSFRAISETRLDISAA